MAQDMTGQINWKSPEKARAMGLDYAPRSPIAVAFCDALGTVLAASETGRKYQRQGDRKRTFNRTAGAIAADLLKTAQHQRERWSWRVLTTAGFTDAFVSHADFTNVMKAAETGGFIEKRAGHYRRYDFGDTGKAGTGQATRFRATPKLIDFAAENDLTPDSVDDHFEQRRPKQLKEVLVLRGSSMRAYGQKIPGSGMSYERTAQTARIDQDVLDLNDFLSRHGIDGGVHRGYRRIFNQGDVPRYRWNKGGRLYSYGDDSYQTLKKERRLQMTLDGEPVAEIDIRASYLTLLHGLKGVPFDAAARDPYKLGPLPRSVIKAWVTMTIGHTTFHSRWPRLKAEELAKEHIDIKRFPLKELRPLILHHLPVLKDWPSQTISNFDLMYLESEAVIGTMMELMREHGVPSLSVHDSIMVPRQRADDACAILKRRYKGISGITPHLEVRPHT